MLCVRWKIQSVLGPQAKKWRYDNNFASSTCSFEDFIGQDCSSIKDNWLCVPCRKACIYVFSSQKWIKGVVSKETVVLRRWRSSTQRFWYYQQHLKLVKGLQPASLVRVQLRPIFVRRELEHTELHYEDNELSSFHKQNKNISSSVHLFVLGFWIKSTL